MNAARNYAFVLRPDGTAELETFRDNSAKWVVLPDELQRVHSAVTAAAFDSMERDYRDVEVTCSGALTITVNRNGVQKTVVALGADPRGERVWNLAKEIRAILGLDARRAELDALPHASSRATSRSLMFPR